MNKKCDMAFNTHDIKELVQLSFDEDPEVRSYVAGNYFTTEKVLRKLANDPQEQVRIQVGRNPNTPLDILEKLSKDNEEMVRNAVASNEATSSKLLSEIAKNETKLFVKLSIAYNKNVSLNQLNTFIEEDTTDGNLLFAVACNEKTTERMLQKIVNQLPGISYKVHIIESVMNHRNCSPELKSQLSVMTLNEKE